MIYIDRARVPVPKSLLSTVADQERRRAAEFFSQPLTTRGQRRYDFPFNLLKRTKIELGQLFYNKCAFCESSLGGADFGEIEHFRPKAEARGLQGNSDPDHYWWLVLEWENLYLTCQICNASKRNFFPVVGPRASVGESLGEERALLIDPCHDRPERYLEFREDGSVANRPMPPEEGRRFENHNRGQVTIDVFQLNRKPLIEGRFQALRQSLAIWEALSSKSMPQKLLERSVSVLQEAVRPEAPYAGAVQQVLAQRIDAILEVEAPDSPLSKAVQPLHDTLKTSLQRAPRQAARRDIEVEAPRRAPTPRATVLRGIGYIKEIHIRNFRILDRLDLELQPESAAKFKRADENSPSQVGWKVLLGENAVGKSTVLQALALALVGKKEAVRTLHNLQLTPADLLRRNQAQGSIRLTLSGEPGAIEVRFDKNSLEFSRGESGANTLVRAYGATRLLPPRQKGKPSTNRQLHDIKNLFDPYARLTDADAWLGETEQTSEESFLSACLTLKDLLAIDEDIRREDGRLMIDVGSGPVSLERLSSGYRASLALAIDLMRAMPNLHDKREATGIVMIDEIDAHLHPRWKMDIVRRLRTAFPGIQFIATTHEPLCLRGLRDGEVAVMRRNSDAISVLEDLPSPEGLRVDQLLISPFFGLDSTVDPALDDLLKRYYRLLATPDSKLTPEQRDELAKIKAQLPRKGVLGYTRRDQLVYEAIDEYLAKEPSLTNESEIRRLREQTKRKVAEIWRGIRSRSDAEPKP
jgi:uncharacterized protein (TIGR02646 family)